VPTRGPGAQPTPPGVSVSVPEVPALPGPPELPSRTPGEQPVDSAPVVVVPTTQEAPPTLIPPVTESTSTTKRRRNCQFLNCRSGELRVPTMRPNQIAHMRMAIVALSMGATLTMAACAQDAPAPSYPSPAPPRSMPVATTPVPPVAGTPVAVPAAPTPDANQPAPPPETGTTTPPPNGDITVPEPPASELPDSPAIIGNEAPDTGPINDE